MKPIAGLRASGSWSNEDVMPGLLEQLRARPKTQAPGVQTQTAQGLLRSKTGRAGVGGSAPRISSQAERAAVAETAARGRELQAQGAQQAKQLEQAAEGQEIQQEAEQQAATDQLLDTQQKAGLQTQNILNELERGEEELDLKKWMSKAEQMSFNMRLNDQKYIQELQNTRARRRMRSEDDFLQQYAESQFAAERAVLQDALGRDLDLLADEAEFRKQLAEMDLQHAIKMAQAQAEQEAITNEYGAYESMVSGGAGIFASFQRASADQPGGTDADE